MPILDPSLQHFLINNKKYHSDALNKDFFLRYLKIAESNINRNINTIQASIQFKEDLMSCSSVISQVFGGKYDFQIDFKNNPLINNCYSYLLDKINENYTTSISENQQGLYYIYKDIYKMRLFQPSTCFSKYHSWYLTDTPIAILCLDFNIIKRYSEDYILQFIKLEVDLMKASGFTLVICAKIDFFLSKYSMEFILKGHQFEEIHINMEHHSYLDEKKYFYKLLETNEKHLLDNGFLYFYTNFFLDNRSNIHLKDIKSEKRFFQLIYFSDDFDKALKTGTTEFTNESFGFKYVSKPFSYCKTGFDYEFIRILLCNVPIYNSSDEESDLIPYSTPGIGFAYINQEDFLNCEDFRVHILFDDIINRSSLIEKYVDFDDIHLIRPDFYVNDSLYLTPTDANTLKSVKNIQNIAKEKLNINLGEFKRENIFHLFKTQQVIKGLQYVVYAYQHYKNIENEKFLIHTNQVFTALEACRICLYNTKKDEKGVIYQVETGEGKSCIIQLIAAVLALSNKTVHIASSNINLSNRDYYESLNFFKQLDLESAVLLHYNELPYINFQNLPNDNNNYQKEFYPEKFFAKKLFNNSSGMNLSVCGIKNQNIVKERANIVYSTFINFECLYLRLMEMFPSYTNKYFNDCSLLIDEADYILIDELTNGTILSRPMNTNGEEVLSYVYDCYEQKKDVKNVLRNIKQRWPKCTDLCENDVIEMYKEIDIIQQPEFTNGKKYSIEKINIKEKRKKKSLNDIKKSVKNGIKDLLNKIPISKDKQKEELADDSIDNIEYKDKSEIIKDKSKKHNEKYIVKEYKTIIPFDYDHKGILEPNKEFNGFIQQFIAIKEKKKSGEKDKWKIKDVSMNYLYVSHPIFVNLYSGVCGLTGTIGNKYDKELLKENYKLITKKIPRNNPNRRIELPILLCSSIEERNWKILNEIEQYHQKSIPILVIFKDLNEIYYMYNVLVSKGIKNINVFDGKDEKIKPDRIAGLNGAISLGTNICGRGTDIKDPIKPLHVVVSYYTANTRVMHQAFGRTARQGKEGTVRVICLLSQFISPIETFTEKSIKVTLNDFDLKNTMQIKFIEEFRKKRKWIFDSKIKSQKIKKEYIKQMRDARININRINAFNYQYPICMSIQTFLDIQAQKVFSLYNCPNCKYTWRLFQKYIREMILESWSLFIDQADREYYLNSHQISYEDFLNNKLINVKECLNMMIPQKQFQSDYDIVPTFMHIFKLVLHKYEDKVLNSFPKKISNVFSSIGSDSFCSFFIGFRPYSLINKSGARIITLGDNDQKQNFIIDPELKYIRKQPNGLRSVLLSITEKIDEIFNKICQKINEVIGSYLGLRFFLRRTLGGCEFGLCFDFELENDNFQISNNSNCIVDKDPLLVFTISVKSMVPLLAGILIIGLVYIAKISATIAQFISCFNPDLALKLVKKTVKIIFDKIVKEAIQNQIDSFCNRIYNFLSNVVLKQIEFIKTRNKDLAFVFNLLLKIAINKDFSKSGDALNDLFEKNSFIKINANFCDQSNFQMNHFLKIGFLLMLAFGSFMVNFHYRSKALKYKTQNVAENYDKSVDPDKTDQAIYENGQFVNEEFYI